MCATTDFVAATPTVADPFGPEEAREIENACAAIREANEAHALLRAAQELAWNDGTPVDELPGWEACAVWERQSGDTSEPLTAEEMAERAQEAAQAMRAEFKRVPVKLHRPVTFRAFAFLRNARAVRRTPAARRVVR
jgi:hypothetical protein